MKVGDRVVITRIDDEYLGRSGIVMDTMLVNKMSTMLIVEFRDGSQSIYRQEEIKEKH